MFIQSLNGRYETSIFLNEVTKPKIMQLDGENVINYNNITKDYNILKNPIIYDNPIITIANKFKAIDYILKSKPNLSQFILDFISDDIPQNYKTGDLLYNPDTREFKIYNGSETINFESGAYGYFYNLEKNYAPETIKEYIQNIIFPLMNKNNYYGKAKLDTIYTKNIRNNDPVSTNQDQYFALFPAYIYIPKDGEYSFGCDGDDAIYFKLNSTNKYSKYLGNHGKAGHVVNPFTINLTTGYYFGYLLMEERGAADNYYLYWKKPGDSDFSIIPKENLFRTDWLKVNIEKLINSL